MINQSDLPKHNITSLDSGQRHNDKQKATLQTLKQLIPEIINSDGQLNYEALKDIIDISQTTANNKGYELTFAGKGLAKAKASSATAYELQSEKQQSKDFDTSQNVVIRGDNLEVLKILKANYFEQIKMIYIDPPYNTKSDNFIYNDNFKTDEADLINKFGLDENTKDFLANVYSTQSHSGWLAFMYPRLKLARDLLKDDGVLFISIDDNEQANLKLLCDEIFGEDNFIYQLSVVNNLNGNDNSSGMMETQESCLIYAKNKDNFQVGVLAIDEEKKNEWEEDELGFWKEGRNLKATGINAPREARPKLYFPIYINENDLTFSLEKTEKFSYKILPITDNKEMSWYWSKDKFLKDKNEVIVKKAKEGFSLYKKQRPSLGDLPSKRGKTTFYKPSYSNSHGNATIKEIFTVKAFDYSKSISLIKDFIRLGNTNSNDLILDFFAGSGTTGDAVMQLNSEDGGNRKFMLVQWDELIDEKKNSEAYRFCSENNFAPVISSITIERLHRAGAKLQKANIGKLEWDNSSLDIGYKVFSLTPKPKIMEGDNNLFTLENTRTKSTDILYNMLCATGKPLHTPVQELIKDSLYLVENIEQNLTQKSFYVLNIPNEEVAKQIITELDNNPNSQIYIDGYSPINLQDWLNLGVDNKDNKNITVVY